MTGGAILDTGPLVAFLNRHDGHHAWAVGQFGVLRPPLVTCQAVLAEACYLLRHAMGGAPAVMDLVQRGIIDASFPLADHAGSIRRLLDKYASVPISLADACLVRISEMRDDLPVLTLDADFRLYRKHGRGIIPTIMPAA